jgi:hypothetical protein
MIATPGSPIQNPKLEILTSITVTNFGGTGMAGMSNGMSYSNPEFIKHPAGTQFAVLFEMESPWLFGEIRQIKVFKNKGNSK